MNSVNQSVGILAAGLYVPPTRLSNDDVEEIVTNYDAAVSGRSLDAWTQERYGITSRAISDELPSEMMAKAIRSAAVQAEISLDEIDFLIVNTAFGDYSQPTTATEVQKRLGLKEGVFALEINMPCSGAIYTSVLASSLLQTGGYRYGVVAGAEKMHRLVDMQDFRTAALFGDGAGAFVLGPEAPWQIKKHKLWSCGEEGHDHDFALSMLGGRAVYPTSEQTIEKGYHQFRMQGKKVQAFAEQAIGQIIDHVEQSWGISLDSFDAIIPHQASKNIVQKAFSARGISESNVRYTLDKYGNTSAASIYITMADSWSSLEMANRILMCGFGGGLNWGAILLEQRKSSS